MRGWQDEQHREVWWELCQRSRRCHAQCLGVKPMLVSERDGYVPPQAMFFRTVEDMETVPYPIDHRAQILEMLVRWAREQNGLAIGTVFQGVSPEEEAGVVHLRPTILTSVMGVTQFDGWTFEVTQRIDREGSVLTLKTPLLRRRVPTAWASEWEPELGGTAVMQGPWPKTVRVWAE